MRHAPALSADLRAPDPDPVCAMLRQVVDDAARLRAQQVTQQSERPLVVFQRDAGARGLAAGARLDLQLVHTPTEPSRQVTRLKIQAARAAAAGGGGR